MHIGLVAGGVALLFFYSRLNEQREKRGRRSTGRGLPRQGDTTAAGPLVGGRRRVEGSHGRQGGGLSVLDGPHELCNDGKIKWDDIAGLENAKKALKEAITLPAKFPQFFTGNRKPGRGVLLFGPPGTGKSCLAQAVAKETGCKLFQLSTENLPVHMHWKAQYEEVGEVFSKACRSAPAIIFVHEIEALFSKEGDCKLAQCRAEFLRQLHILFGSEARVSVIATSNFPYQIDSDLSKHSDKLIEVHLPEKRARTQIFKRGLGDTPMTLTPVDFSELGRSTEGLSGADIVNVVNKAPMEPVRLAHQACCFRPVIKHGKQSLEPCTQGAPNAIRTDLESLAAQGQAAAVSLPDITMNMMNRALAKARPSVTRSDLDMYHKFEAEFC